MIFLEKIKTASEEEIRLFLKKYCSPDLNPYDTYIMEKYCNKCITDSNNSLPCEKGEEFCPHNVVFNTDEAISFLLRGDEENWDSILLGTHMEI